MWGGKIGCSYYDLGIEPYVIYINEMLFMGFGISIIIIDLKNRIVKYSDNDAMHVVYEVKLDAKRNIIIYVCELKILCFDFAGKKVWEVGVCEVICDWEYKDDGIVVKLNNGIETKLLFSTGDEKY